MFNKRDFYNEMFKVALPITFQSLFQSSVSVIDQVMVGQLGSTSITGAGLGGKFSSLFTVTVSAVATGAGILIAQYYGNKSRQGVNNSFISNLYFSLIIGVFFTIISMTLPVQIMSLYSADPAAVNEASSYLRIVAVGFIPMTLTLMISTLLRCIGQAKYPMWASIASVILNTVLNYILIFGKLSFPAMGLQGAAYSTDIARITEFILVLILLLRAIRNKDLYVSFHTELNLEFIKKVFMVLYPILICEFLWSLGENGYAVIYGRIGTDACAAMTLTNPIQSLMIGLFSGIAAAAGIITGKALGDDRYDDAYIMAKKMIKIGIVGSILLAVIFSSCASLYVDIFSVNNSIKQDTVYILYVFSIMLFIKVSNMILGGGVLRSGGRTIIIMFIDMIGTWMFGIPLGIMAAFIFNLPIYAVYFILSLEELVRLLISLAVFKKKIWMKNIT
ncbi:MATE family efflux transporter [uncultured Clostridium sp.]|uniref:MATE family efflux transporter n=1 Tax=uncultured Clostridium sp. TaxID=59620 RepID=UPI0025EB7B6B|nr:MATE family efflux transporter [uncultured Clostridium sp.]